MTVQNYEPPQERAAFIAIVGRPNVGKSSLLNRMLGEKVAIVSPKPQTTRTRIMGVYTKGADQIAFLDTPGLLRARNELGQYMVKTVLSSVSGVDACLLVVEAGAKISPADEELIEKFRREDLPAILAINKIDLLEDKTRLMEQIAAYAGKYPFEAVVPVSARDGSGIDELLEELKSGALHHCVLDLSACPGGCIGAPGSAGRLASAQMDIRRRVREEGEAPYFDTHGIAMMNPAIARPVKAYVPTEQEIQEMLYQIGVGNPRQQQNCGACGFATCRERAQAILEHKENVSLCRRVVYEARRDMFSVVYDNLPMAAILVDESQKVVGLNSEACSLFSMKPDQEKYIFKLMDPVDFQYVQDTGLPIKNRRIDIPEIYMRVEANLVPLKSLHMVLGLFRDITEEEEAEAAQQRSRLQSVEMAQKVIEKQMTVAQQIAFLLGETTAETKVTLNQLKSRILGEEDNA